MPGYDGKRNFIDLTTIYLGIDESTSDLDTSIEEALRAEPLSFVRSGFYNYNTSGLAQRGSRGYFWSSRASSATNAYYLYFYSTRIDPQYDNGKGNGYSLRCVAR